MHLKTGVFLLLFYMVFIQFLLLIYISFIIMLSHKIIWIRSISLPYDQLLYLHKSDSKNKHSLVNKCHTTIQCHFQFIFYQLKVNLMNLSTHIVFNSHTAVFYE